MAFDQARNSNGRQARNRPRNGNERNNSNNSNHSNRSSNPKKNFDHYTALARTALAAGDFVESQNYFQHAEHFYRMMSSDTNKV